MKFVSYLPAYGYLLILILFLHVIGLFPYCIDLPIFGGEITNYGKVNEVTRGIPINLNGEKWYPTWGLVILIVAVIMLYWELLKSTQISNFVTFDHALSTIVFMTFFGLWLSQKWAGNSLMLTLSLMSLLDVIAGFTITIKVANRDVSIGGGK